MNAINKNERIRQLKEKISLFQDSDFGEPISVQNPQHIPEIKPPKAHPRLFVTPKRLEEIRANLHAEENKYAYEKYLQLSDSDCDGVVHDHLDENSSSHYRIIDADIITCIEAKAFRYLLTQDELYGYEAIAALKSYLKTFDLSHIPAGIAHYTALREMPFIASVYDWCYDLLTDKDKYHIISAATSKLPKYFEFPSFPPSGGSIIVGHMSGALNLTVWYSLGIAIYDEYPEIYNVIADINYNKVIPAQNYYLESGQHSQGSAYGPERHISLVEAEGIFTAMFDGERHLFTEKLEDVCVSFLHMLRPDGEMLRIGDEFNEGTRYAGLPVLAFRAGNMYGNPVLKGFAKKILNNFSTFFALKLTPVSFLIKNNPEVPCADLSDLPLVNYNGSPCGSMIARSSWTDPDAIMTYMKIGESYSANHEHKDAGNFQIYHKGILASKSGHYGLYGSPLDLAYNKQTIAANSLLIYNPNMQDNGKWIYSGGQRISDEANEEPLNLEVWKSKSTYAQGKVLYHGYKTCEDKEGEKLCYSYLSGDITNAYDPETVSEVKRHMFSFMTGRDDHPMVFVVFDRITSMDKSYKKTFLLHMQTRPLIWNTPSGKPCAVISNLSSRLYVQSLITDMDYEMIGGPGNEYNVKGINYSEDLYKGQPLLYTYNSEGGWGRLEISPAAPAETDLLLTVMYPAADTDYSPKLVFGDYNTLPFHEAVEIKNDTLIGAAILNTAVIFPKNGTCFEDQVSFTLPENAAVKKCYVNCLKGGKWQLSDGRIVTVEAENGMAEFDVIDTLDITLQRLAY